MFCSHCSATGHTDSHCKRVKAAKADLGPKKLVSRYVPKIPERKGDPDPRDKGKGVLMEKDADKGNTSKGVTTNILVLDPVKGPDIAIDRDLRRYVIPVMAMNDNPLPLEKEVNDLDDDDSIETVFDETANLATQNRRIDLEEREVNNSRSKATESDDHQSPRQKLSSQS